MAKILFTDPAEYNLSDIEYYISETTTAEAKAYYSLKLPQRVS